MRQFRTRLTGIFLGLLGTFLASLGFYAGFYERLERLTLDFRFRHFNKSIQDSRQLSLVAIDDGSLANVGDWPWPRTHLARIIKVLNELESREIVVDLVLSMPKSNPVSGAEDADEPSEDEVLAQACREHGQVILAAYFTPGAATAPVVDLLVANFQLLPEQIARETGWAIDEVQSNFASCRRLAARRLVADLLTRHPRLEKSEAVVRVLGPQETMGWEQRQEIERAYDYVQAYLQVRTRFGWSIEGEDLRPPIKPVSDEMQMVVPAADLADSCQDVGFVNFHPDPDGKVREITLLGSFDRLIYRQLALAGICQHLQIEPGKFLIGTRGIDLRGGGAARRSASRGIVLTSPESTDLRIPITRDGRMIINWYAPHPNRWDRSFEHLIPAARLLEIAFRQEALRKNRALLADAMMVTVRHCLPGDYDEYVKLTRRLPMLKEGVEISPSEPGPPPTDESELPTDSDGSTESAEDDGPTVPAATQPATASSPATTVEQDLILSYQQTQARIEQIETGARQQLQWLYEQLPQLPVEERTRAENVMIRDLWRCLNAPGEIRQVNAELETAINRKIEAIYPLVQGKIVLIGYTASTLTDFVPTPVFDRCPGVLVHANILNQILEGAFLHESDRNNDLLVILVIGTLVSIISAQRSAFEGLLWMLLLFAGFFLFTCHVVFARLHVVSSLIGPLSAIVLSWSLVSFYRQLTEGRAKRVFANRLSQYTNPVLARRIAEQPEGMELVPELRQVTCYFSDLAGFTPLSEKLGPEQTVGFLNIYLEHMSEVLDRQEAFVNKFLADGIFAFFNPPLHNQDDHARRACLAAIDTQAALPHIREHLIAQFPLQRDSLAVRIGISTGKAVVGDCGSRRKFDYTCLGDTVNLASRLESANKFFETDILICDRTFRSMGDDLLARLLGKIRVVGRKQPVIVYELIGYRDAHADQIEFTETFGQMVLACWRSEFDSARTLLDQIRSLDPDDPPGKIYQGILDRIARDGPTVFRDGVIEIETK